MSKIKKTYTFSGFGFDVLLHNVEIKQAHGEEYPDINFNEIKLFTAKELLKNRERLTGKKLKFLRTFLKISYQKLSEIIDVPASTLRLWEEKGNEATGMSAPQERQMRFFTIESILDLERRHIEKQIIMSETFEAPSHETLDLGESQDYSFLKEA
jgi:DNA-binding transcriptional regulator YiaG